jgi:hypothetical protein
VRARAFALQARHNVRIWLFGKCGSAGNHPGRWRRDAGCVSATGGHVLTRAGNDRR